MMRLFPAGFREISGYKKQRNLPLFFWGLCCRLALKRRFLYLKEVIPDTDGEFLNILLKRVVFREYIAIHGANPDIVGRVKLGAETGSIGVPFKIFHFFVQAAAVQRIFAIADRCQQFHDAEIQRIGNQVNAVCGWFGFAAAESIG